MAIWKSITARLRSSRFRVRAALAAVLFTLTLLAITPTGARTDLCSTCQNSCWSEAQTVYNDCITDSNKIYNDCMAPWLEGGYAGSPEVPGMPDKQTVCTNRKIDAASQCPTKQTDAYNNCLYLNCNFGLGCHIPKAPYSSPGSN